MTVNHNTDGDFQEEVPTVDPIISEDSSENSEDQNSSEDRENREDSRFKEGQILRFVRVRFPGNSRSFSFLIGKRTIEYGQKVVAMSDRGMAVGYVNSFPYDLPFNKSMLPIRSISKVAADDDIVKDKEAYRQQKEAENICNDLIEDHKLDMHLTHVEFTSFGKKAIFYFIAPSRVDFRDLVRDLVQKLKTRIELRQISVRDRSAAIGGIGPCGRELCCSSFLTKYGNVGIKMAKNQDLTLNFSKLNGVCGQLKCCLQYEDDVYREKRNKLPKENDIITTHTGETGKVLRLHLLSEQFDILTTRGVKKRFVVDLYKETLNKEEANFPKEFDSVTDETHKIVGLDEAETKKTREFEAEIKALKIQSKDFAEKTFEALFGEKTLGLSLPEVDEPDSDRPKMIVNPDDEEELTYTPSDDEVLDEEDEDNFLEEDEPIRTRFLDAPQERGSHSEANRGPRPQRNDQRDRQPVRRDHRAARSDRPHQDGPRDGQGRGQQNQNSNRPRGGNPGRDQGRRGPNQQGQAPQGRNRPPR
jgi:cell fate regulator YaaT (PSP1 superfamily)